VAVKIKLKRLGKIRAPYYRIIVADARTKRDGRAIEEIGKYHPKAEPSFIEVNSERAQHWLSVGAQPTDPVRKILEITGDWQKFKGLPGTEGTLKTAAPKEDRREIFAAAVKETLGDGTTTTKSRGRSGGGKDADSGADKSGKADKADKDAGSGRGGRQAKAKSGEQSGKAAKSGGDTAAKAGGDAAAKAGGDTAAKAGGDAAAKASGDTAAKAGGDAAAKASGDTAAKGKGEGTGDAPAAEAPAAEAPAAEAPAADEAAADAPAGDAAEAKAEAEPAAADPESASGD
jgi:small subunit ribosomal protein S16